MVILMSGKNIAAPGPGGRGMDLTCCSIWRTLFALSAPVVLGMALQTGFNIVDTIFVGMLGSEQLAAISVTFPVVFIFIAIASGLTIGSTALMSHAIGAGRQKEASNIAEHSLLAAVFIGLAVAAVGIAFSPPIFSFMGVSGHILEMTIQYANLIFIGFLFLFIGFLSQGIIQAGGDTVTPTKNLAVSVALNVVLDPLFIFGFGPVPAMGLAGAGMATVISRGVGAALNIQHVMRGKARVKLDPRNFRFDYRIISGVLKTGTPSSVSQSINSIGMILLMGLVGTFGTAAIAAFGVGLRLESLAILPVIGLSSALVPFVGQNLGAGRTDRAKRAVSLTSYVAALYMVMFMALWYFVPGLMYSPFTADPEVIATGVSYLMTISFGYVFLGLDFVIGAAFQAAGRTTLQMILNLLRWAVTVALAYTLVGLLGITGVWAGFPLGNLAGFILFFFILRSGFWLKKWESERHGHS